MSSLPPDPYIVLGVSKDAQLPEIRAAHRKLVLKCHPDKVQDPEQKEIKQKEFQRVQQAYELLSNEAERSRYDDKVRLEELKREKAATAASSPRTSRRTETKYDVRDAEPRSTTFASSPPSHGVYGHTPPSRSWDGGLYERRYDEKPRHAARKTASYEKTTTYEYEKEKPSRKEEERRRQKEEDEWAREKMKEKAKEFREREQRERERDLLKEKEREAKKDKERRKEERKEDKKKTDKDRRKESDEKHRRHRSPYVETYPPEVQEEVIYMTTSSSKSDKKKSSSGRKYEEIPTASPSAPRETSRPPPPTSERERKNSETLDFAIRYLGRSGGNPPTLGRSKTYHPEFSSGIRHITPIAVPTPPPAAGSMFAPPPMAEPIDEEVRRSSGRPRRMSHDTPRSSKEKSHKKTGSSREPIIVDTPSPGARIIPSLQKSHSIPISGMSDAHRVPPLNRSNTDSYSRPPLAHGLERAATWMEDSNHGRDRSRSRQTGIYLEESSEDDRDHRRRRGRRTQSPDVIPISSTKRYTVDTSSGKAIPIRETVRESYFEESPRSSKKNSYPMPNSSARRVDHRAGGYYVHDEYEEEPQVYSGGFNVKYSDTFDPNAIKFSSVPHREELYA
ncbi:DnaJ-domain-containing protein [Hypomontagnella monticulosa]|nr:DnaJ-domain-containing protein [Hypomontagnella monticulosa]